MMADCQSGDPSLTPAEAIYLYAAVRNGRRLPWPTSVLQGFELNSVSEIKVLSSIRLGQVNIIYKLRNEDGETMNFSKLRNETVKVKLIKSSYNESGK